MTSSPRCARSPRPASTTSRSGCSRREEKQLATIRALAEAATATRLVACLFADRERDPARLIAPLAEAGFAGVMLDTADKASGRLLAHASIPALSAFVRAAKERGLMVGLAGGLEAPDVPRLLSLQARLPRFPRRALRRRQARGRHRPRTP